MLCGGPSHSKRERGEGDLRSADGAGSENPRTARETHAQRARSVSDADCRMVNRFP